MNRAWSFFIYRGKNILQNDWATATFMYLLNYSLQSDIVSTLRPDRITKISSSDFDENAIDGKVSAIESNHAPIILTATIDATSSGKNIISNDYFKKSASGSNLSSIKNLAFYKSFNTP